MAKFVSEYNYFEFKRDFKKQMLGTSRGGYRDFEKGGWGGGLYIDHQGWPVKKILVFRWFKKAEVTPETISFWQNISISIFKFSPFLSIKSYQFFKIY